MLIMFLPEDFELAEERRCPIRQYFFTNLLAATGDFSDKIVDCLYVQFCLFDLPHTREEFTYWRVPMGTSLRCLFRDLQSRWKSTTTTRKTKSNYNAYLTNVIRTGGVYVRIGRTVDEDDYELVSARTCFEHDGRRAFGVDRIAALANKIHIARTVETEEGLGIEQRLQRLAKIDI